MDWLAKPPILLQLRSPSASPPGRSPAPARRASRRSRRAWASAMLVTRVAAHPSRALAGVGLLRRPSSQLCAMTGGASGRCACARGDGDAVTALAWSPDGLRLCRRHRARGDRVLRPGRAPGGADAPGLCRAGVVGSADPRVGSADRRRAALRRAGQRHARSRRAPRRGRRRHRRDRRRRLEQVTYTAPASRHAGDLDLWLRSHQGYIITALDREVAGCPRRASRRQTMALLDRAEAICGRRGIRA